MTTNLLLRRSAERIAFGYLVSQKFTGEKATLEVRAASYGLVTVLSLGAAESVVEPLRHRSEP